MTKFATALRDKVKEKKGELTKADIEDVYQTIIHAAERSVPRDIQTINITYAEYKIISDDEKREQFIKELNAFFVKEKKEAEAKAKAKEAEIKAKEAKEMEAVDNKAIAEFHKNIATAGESIDEVFQICEKVLEFGTKIADSDSPSKDKTIRKCIDLIIQYYVQAFNPEESSMKKGLLQDAVILLIRLSDFTDADNRNAALLASACGDVERRSLADPATYYRDAVNFFEAITPEERTYDDYRKLARAYCRLGDYQKAYTTLKNIKRQTDEDRENMQSYALLVEIENDDDTDDEVAGITGKRKKEEKKEDKEQASEVDSKESGRLTKRRR